MTQDAAVLDSPRNVSSRPALRVVAETLQALAHHRIGEERDRKWDDTEVEPRDFNNAYKYVDGLSPFFLAYRLFPSDFARFPLPDEVILADLRYIIDSVTTNRFVPGAYTFETVSEYVDYAADVLRLLLDFRYWAQSARIEHGLGTAVDTVIANAIRFLIDAARTDVTGTYWAGTRPDGSPGHIYYTAKAVQALSHALTHWRPMLEDDRERAQMAIQGAGIWFTHRVKAETYFSDDNNEIADSIARLYPLFGLGAAWEYQNARNPRLLSFVSGCAESYSHYLTENYDDFNKEIYYRVVMDGTKVPFNVEDRSSGGTCLAAFSLIWGKATQVPLARENLYQFIQDLSSRVRQERDDRTKLWYKGEFYLYATVSSVEGLLYQERFARAVGVDEFNEVELSGLVKRVLENRMDDMVRLFVDEFRAMSGERQVQS